MEDSYQPQPAGPWPCKASSTCAFAQVKVNYGYPAKHDAESGQSLRNKCTKRQGIQRQQLNNVKCGQAGQGCASRPMWKSGAYNQHSSRGANAAVPVSSWCVCIAMAFRSSWSRGMDARWTSLEDWVAKKQLEPCDGRPLVGVAGSTLEDCGSQEAVGAVGWMPVGPPWKIG